MNSKELLAHLEDGARLYTRWRYGKRINTLVLKDGTTLKIQTSTIRALSGTGKVLSVDISGGNYNYYLLKGNYIA